MSDNKFVDSKGVKIIYKYALEKSKQYTDNKAVEDNNKIDAILSDIANATEEENNG